jgi:hypothetical protein
VSGFTNDPAGNITSDGKPAFKAHLAPIEIGGEMARVGQDEHTFLREGGTKTGNKPAVTGGVDLTVERFEQYDGAGGCCGNSLQGANRAGAGHGGAQTFAADVADDDEN